MTTLLSSFALPSVGVALQTSLLIAVANVYSVLTWTNIFAKLRPRASFRLEVHVVHRWKCLRIADMNPPSSEKPSSGGFLNIGNATGTNRTKVALKPGYSLNGWIRFASKSGDLSGVKDKSRLITKEELSLHNTEKDCWMSINGSVYNVTAYGDYHPGGLEELMRGAGQDATQLFNDNHTYVNYESLLQKCYVGKLGH